MDTLLDSWSSIKDSLCAVSEVLSSRVEGLDSRLQEARTEIADTFATLTGEFSAIIEAKRSKAIDVVNTLEKNLRSAFAELSHITRDVEEKTAALAAFYAKARDVRCPRGQRRVAAKKARETLRYLEVCYEPLLRTPLPSLSSDEAALAVSSFQPVVSLGASLKNFSEHIKEYASLVEV